MGWHSAITAAGATANTLLAPGQAQLWASLPSLHGSFTASHSVVAVNGYRVLNSWGSSSGPSGGLTMRLTKSPPDNSSLPGLQDTATGLKRFPSALILMANTNPHFSIAPRWFPLLRSYDDVFFVQLAWLRIPGSLGVSLEDSHVVHVNTHTHLSPTPLDLILRSLWES